MSFLYRTEKHWDVPAKMVSFAQRPAVFAGGPRFSNLGERSESETSVP